MKLKRRGLITALIMAVLLTSGHISSAARVDDAAAITKPQANRGFDGADVIFMVDQSGSMGGVEFQSEAPGRPATDPDNMRFLTVEFGIDWVGNFRAAQAALGNDLDIHVGAVYFGGVSNEIGSREVTEVALPLTPITAENPAEWQGERDSLMSQVGLDAFGYRNLGNTDFIAGFEQVLAEMRPADSRRLQLVIVLTDGAPCAPDRFSDRSCATASDQINHMDDLHTLVNQAFESTNQHIYTIALDANSAYWPRFENAWRSITDDSAERLDDPRDMGVRLNDILEGYFVGLEDDSGGVTEAAPAVRPLAPNQTQRLYQDGLVGWDVLPYQQLMTVTLFKTDRAARLTVLDPNSASVSVNRADVFVTGEDTLIETWQIANPMPGRWVFGSRLDTQGLYADLSPNFRLTFVRALFSFHQPLNQQQEYLKFEYTINVTDANGAALVTYPNDIYQLVGDVHVTRPDGIVVDVPITSSGNPGEYHAEFTPFSDGLYSATVTAYVGSRSGDPIFSAAPSDTVRVMPTFVEISGLPERVLENIPQTYQLRLERGDGTAVSGVEIEQFIIALLPPESSDCSTAVTGNASTGLEIFDDFEMMDGFATLEAVHHALGEHVVCARVVARDLADPNRATQPIYDGEYGDPITVIGLRPLRFTVTLADQAAQTGQSITLPDQVTKYAPLLEQFPDLPISVPYWTEEPVLLSVNVRDKESDTPFLLRPLAEAANNPTLFTLEILDAANRRVESELVVTPTDNGAVWSVSIPPLPTGRYAVTISTTSQAYGEDRAFHPDDAVISFTLEITPNALRQTWDIAKISTVVVVVVIAALILVTFVLARINPISGTLVLLRVPKGASDPASAAVMVRTISLRSRGKNRYTVPLTELPLIDPPLTELSLRGGRGQVRVKFGLNGADYETDLQDNRSEELFEYRNDRFFLRWESGRRS